ncbi:MAG: hypothetical protein WDZ57_03555, partial [Demequina sp.]
TQPDPSQNSVPAGPAQPMRGLGFGMPKIVPQQPQTSVSEHSAASVTPRSDPPSGRGADRPLIPTESWDDSDEGWGDPDTQDSRDEQLRRDKPPHW